MRTDSWMGVTAILMMMFVGAAGAGEQQCRPSPIPSNVDLPRHLEPALQRIHDRSPAFRAQCERIGRADNLRVSVRIDHAIPTTAARLGSCSGAVPRFAPTCLDRCRSWRS